MDIQTPDWHNLQKTGRDSTGWHPVLSLPAFLPAARHLLLLLLGIGPQAASLPPCPQFTGNHRHISSPAHVIYAFMHVQRDGCHAQAANKHATQQQPLPVQEEVLHKLQPPCIGPSGMSNVVLLLLR